MPTTICVKLNITPQNNVVHIVQIDRTKVEVLGEINSVSIQLSSNPKVYQIIDILVVGIRTLYGLLLIRDWSEKIHGYFATNWSRKWLPYNGKPNQMELTKRNI